MGDLLPELRLDVVGHSLTPAGCGYWKCTCGPGTPGYDSRPWTGQRSDRFYRML